MTEAILQELQRLAKEVEDAGRTYGRFASALYKLLYECALHRFFRAAYEWRCWAGDEPGRGTDPLDMHIFGISAAQRKEAEALIASVQEKHP